MANVPQFSFYVKEITLRAGRPQLPPGAPWVPPSAPGSHVPVAGLSGVGGVAGFHCNGVEIVSYPPVTMPDENEPTWFKTFTVYRYNDAIYIINYDATEAPVGDAHPTGEPLETPDSPRYMYWRPLFFDWHGQRGNHVLSYVTYQGLNRHLEMQREDQMWPYIILPQAFHAPVVRRLGRHNEISAGLIGELPLILALIAMSRDARFIFDVFRIPLVNGCWDLRNFQQDREDFRGVVVSVHADPNTHQILTNYEQGMYGAIIA